jgi:hypothetical protein
MQIFTNRNTQKHGPSSLEDVQAYLASGQLSSSDMAWYEGAPNWVHLSQVPGVKMPEGRVPPPPPPMQPAYIPVAAPVQPVVVQHKDQSTPWVAVIISVIFPVIGLILWLVYTASSHYEKAKAVGWASLLSILLWLLLIGASGGM